jgi:hypothetical protein
MKKFAFLFLLLLVGCSTPKNSSRSIPNLNFGSGPNTGTGESLNSFAHKMQILIDDWNRLGMTDVLTTPAEMNLLHNLDDNTVNIRTLVTMEYTAAGDTSNYPVPVKFGDFYWDSSAEKLYFAKTAARGGWIKLN